MSWWIAVGLYLVASVLLALLVGKCIAFGMGTDLERDDADRE